MPTRLTFSSQMNSDYHFAITAYSSGVALAMKAGSFLAETLNFDPVKVAGEWGFIGCLIYAVIHLWLALRASDKARIDDAKNLVEELRKDVNEANESREKMRQTMDNNSTVMNQLTTAISSLEKTVREESK